ncbi:rhodanese-like domain-containing protein [Corallococcus macrosporus]|uniref:Rhodanese-like domain-containing protein n=1 Tax=Corallococcus macrosporus TaxID=35 RepID=A0ABS3DIW0_9BACT|nr:rhodanese-like domain-containing protein [Corallococcus macrosporus]MBN8231262.1 rhodanese-like domain-containing protein [Corallococcus macrosporus]
MSRPSIRFLAAAGLGFALPLAVVGACATPREEVAPATRPATAVTATRAQELVAHGALLLDVRTQEEYGEGHLVGAQHLSLQSLQAGERPAIPADQPVIVYCRTGRRSAQAAQVLREAGFQHVHDLGAMENGVGAFGASPAVGQ